MYIVQFNKINVNAMSTFYGLIFVFDFMILIESQFLMFSSFLLMLMLMLMSLLLYSSHDVLVFVVVIVIILLFISVTINRRILHHRANEEPTTNYRIKYQFYATRC